MKVVRAAVLVLIACLLVCAGCSGPGGSPDAVPTNEPTDLPTPATTATSAPAPVVPSVTAPPYTTAGVPYQTATYAVPRYQGTGPYGMQYIGAGYVTPGSSSGYSGSNIDPGPSDPNAITFRHYADANFAVDYPAGWTGSRSGYVKFASPGDRVALVAEVIDYPPNLAGDYRTLPDIVAVQDLVSRQYPRYDARSIVSDYRQVNVNGVPAVVYSVRLPGGSIAYTQYIALSLHHFYRFTFSSDATTFDRFRPLRDYMFGTLVINDAP